MTCNWSWWPQLCSPSRKGQLEHVTPWGATEPLYCDYPGVRGDLQWTCTQEREYTFLLQSGSRAVPSVLALPRLDGHRSHMFCLQGFPFQTQRAGQFADR